MHQLFGAAIAVYARAGGRALDAARDLFSHWGADGRVLDLVDTPVGAEGVRVSARFACLADACHALNELRDLGRGLECVFLARTAQ